MRLTIREEPEQRCPHCSGPVLCEVLGTGGTRRPMPFFQQEEGFYTEATRSAFRYDD